MPATAQVPRTTFAGHNPFGISAKAKAMELTDLDSISICNDPPRNRRAVATKFRELFFKLKKGQALKVKPIDTPKVASALREYNKLMDRGGKVAQTADYGDGMGRVWWLEA